MQVTPKCLPISILCNLGLTETRNTQQKQRPYELNGQHWPSIYLILVFSLYSLMFYSPPTNESGGVIAFDTDFQPMLD